jgi:WD40-like Beta Propeller Repeat
VISGPGNDGTPTFSPDGRTLYFYRYGTSPDSAVIFESHRTRRVVEACCRAVLGTIVGSAARALARRSHARLCFTAQASF